MAQTQRIIVDSQIHIWKADSPDRPWNLEASGPQLPEPMTIERLIPIMDEGGVDKALIVPPTLEGLRFDLGQDAARNYPGRFATLSRPNFTDPSFAQRMAKMSSEPAWLGWRIILRPSMARWLSDGTTDWFWSVAEKLRQPVSFLAPQQTPLFYAIAERYPQLQLIIDHMGAVPEDVADGSLPQRIAQTAGLAKYPNVSVKLSMVAMLSKQQYPWRDVNDHIKRLYDVFGPERCHWGTDITNNPTRTAMISSMKERVTHFTEELPFLSESDKDWIMGKSIMQKLNWA